MAHIYEREEYRNLSGVFHDRFEAGEVLGRMLAARYENAADLILMAIPMGGVPVAVKIRDIIGCPMDLLIVRKIQIPGNTEAGFGAMTSEGDVFLNEPLLAQLRLNEREVERQSSKVIRELAERSRRLRDDRPFPDLEGKTVILVDDGLASGYTMKASIFMANKRNAAKTIVAVPTAPQRTIDALTEGVDEIYCANIREVLSFAVAEAYENWRDLDESEVADLLARIHQG